MTEETKQSEQARDRAPGDIGDLRDENSLARRLLDTIDRSKQRVAVLGTAFRWEANGLEGDEDLNRDGLAIICDDILNDLMEAHKILSSASFYKEGGKYYEQTKVIGGE